MRTLSSLFPVMASLCLAACSGTTEPAASSLVDGGTSDAPASTADAADAHDARDAGPDAKVDGVPVFAMRKMFWGDTDWNGAANANAWKQYGENVDGKVTDRTSTDVCTRGAG